MTDLPVMAELRLWQLISPALPVGAYAYSAGLETAIESGWVNDADSLQHWVAGQLEAGLAGLDLPILRRLHRAWARDDHGAVAIWTARLLASRESAELRSEDVHIGRALARLLDSLGVEAAAVLDRGNAVSLATAFALAAHAWDIPVDAACRGYAWAWCENQVAAAVKLIPLGQSDGQWALANISEAIPAAVNAAAALPDEEIGATTPGLAMASSWHETQYTRLFRS
ncbi:urease accessory protein UreF [Spiribacter onubensis]|uniref:Urease accessory protein UreF n=1 Tax=Spiribacter onubensis TaxID=3122420 RepID=A0ABV3SBP3_9GAMM